MAAQGNDRNGRARLAVRTTRRQGELDGAWWPRTHTLSEEIPNLFASWSTDNGHITQVLYSPPNWDDRPGTVVVAGRRAPVRTSNITQDDPGVVVLVMLDGSRWCLAVIPPTTDAPVATRRLNEFAVGR